MTDDAAKLAIARKHGTDLRGGHPPTWFNWTEIQALAAMTEYAQLAVEQERERCAKVCEKDPTAVNGRAFAYDIRSTQRKEG